MRITHVITGLGTGGAEMMLFKLLSCMQGTGIVSAVVALSTEGPIASWIRDLGVDVTTLGMRPGLGALMSLSTLRSAVVKSKPDLVQAWMYHANVALSVPLVWGGLSAPVVWNIRSALDTLGEEKRSTRAVIRAGASLSSRPACIVYNSRVAAAQHERIGYDRTKTLVIANGFDTERFQPDEAARKTVRREWGADENTFIVGHVARYHPMKDHAGFLDAARELSSRTENVRFILAGRNVAWTNPDLVSAVATRGLTQRVMLLGEQLDTPRLFNGFDAFVSSSRRQEGFSNVLGEAMACGVPCVATDIGDAAYIVADTGTIVPAASPAALGAALDAFRALPPSARREMGDRARQRVLAEFALPKVVDKYRGLYRRLVSR